MQKTAYEMRISDCSSDVCSSDLRQTVRRFGWLSIHWLKIPTGRTYASARMRYCAIAVIPWNSWCTNAGANSRSAPPSKLYLPVCPLLSVSAPNPLPFRRTGKRSEERRVGKVRVILEDLGGT